MGLRIALGALPGRIAGRFLGAGLRVCLLGGAFGLIIAAACGRWLNGLLYGVSALDPLTYATVFVLVAATGALASLLPALRASRVHPTEVLRQD